MSKAKPKGTFVEMIVQAQNQARTETLNELLAFLIPFEEEGSVTLKAIVKNFIRPLQERIKQSKTTKP